MKTPGSLFTVRTLSLIFFLLSSLQVLANKTGNDDKNVVIENKSQSFVFKRDKGENPVSIREEYSVLYRCREVRDNITFSEMYNDQQTINDVEVYVNKKPFRGVDIKYDYYSIRDIFYSDARICHFKLPLEKKDAEAEVTLKKTHKDPRYFTKVYFSEDYFVQDKLIKFIVPRWMKCELKEYNFAGSDIKKTVTYDSKEDADVYTYRMKDLPAIKQESYDPGVPYTYPHVLVLCKEAETDSGKQTYFKTIADQYAWCYNIVKDIADDDAVLKAKAEEITTGISGDLNKVKAVFNWVHQNIRYIAYEDGIAAFKPAKATDVMNKKYGDCKGMANLLKGLLKNIGQDVRLCWIGTNHIPYDLSTPSLSVHNHMIAAWLNNGKTHFLDGTETNIAFGHYAERIAGRQVMIENGDKYILTNIPTVTAEQNPDKEKRILAIDGQNLKGSAEHLYKGEARSDLINRIAGTKKDNLEKTLLNFLSENNQDYTISNIKKSNIPGTDSVLNISYDVLYKNGASAFGNDIYLEMEFRKELESFTIDTAKREHHMQFPNKILMDQETELTIPAGYKVSTLPANLALQNPVLDINITYRQQGDKLIYRKQLKIKQTLLKKEDFGLWNKQIQLLSEKYKEQVVLSK